MKRSRLLVALPFVLASLTRASTPIASSEPPPSPASSALDADLAVNAAKVPGVDIGAQVNNAILALPTPAVASGDTVQHCGVVEIPQNAYTFSTTIIKPNCVTLEGNGAKLSYTGKGYGIISASPVLGGAATLANAVGGINNLWLFGGANLSAGPTTSNGLAGLLVGGDPSGATPANYGAQHQTYNNMHIEGWQNGVFIGRLSSLDSFHGGDINNNGNGIWYPINATFGSGEDYSFFGTEINNSYSTGILNDGCGEFRMHGGSIDYTGGVPGQPFYKGVKPALSGQCVDFQAFGTHIEQDGGPMLQVQHGAVSLFGGELYASSKTATRTSYINVVGSAISKIESWGTQYSADHPMNSNVSWNQTVKGGAVSLHGTQLDDSCVAPVTGNVNNVTNWDVVKNNQAFGPSSRAAAGGVGGNGMPASLQSGKRAELVRYNDAGMRTTGGFTTPADSGGAGAEDAEQVRANDMAHETNEVAISSTHLTHPTWTSGPSAPAHACTSGSLYSDTAPAAAHTLWVCQAGSWVAK
ncbi:hypothetical protein [Acidipila sp. EB88]|uniref:hypothetical protein n=1 Tax=Acidipila sp. EB88 TaxID=2305226 RepID=UPI000F5EC919|nr:hypothetical protein [Acidipila sp. EB88]RRA47602.1 hypothetical protein D1Y84_04145 [Acidipila sp. EB88]